VKRTIRKVQDGGSYVIYSHFIKCGVYLTLTEVKKKTIMFVEL